MATTTKTRKQYSAKQKEKFKAQREAKTNSALTRLKEGIQSFQNSETWTSFLDVQKKFHKYSANNLMLIWFQNPTATQVAGYRKWQELGRQVRKGEKGLDILAPVTIKVTEDNVDQFKKPIGSYVVVGFKTTTVFDISQTDGEDLPEIITPLMGDDREVLNRLIQFTTSKGFDLTWEESKRGENGYCQYLPSGQIKINISPNDSTVMQAKTLAHELGHALLHNADEYRQHGLSSLKELEAESVAYCVLNHFDVDTSEYTFGYISSWNPTDDAIAQMQESTGRIIQATQSIVNWIEEKSVSTDQD